MSNDGAKPRRKRRRWTWWVAAAVVAAVIITVLAVRPPQVQVETAHVGDLTATVTATGDVEGRVADVVPTVQGRVDAVYRDEGDWVSRGDLLCRITAAPGMAGTGATATDTESILAPFDGVVSRRMVDPGDAALPGSPLYQVADVSTIWVTALVDDIDVAKVQVGQAAEIVLPAYLGRSVPGTITRVGRTAVPRTATGAGGRIVRTRVDLTGPTHGLRPGMEIDVKTESVIARNALLVPADAIIEDETGRWVYLVRDGRAHRTRVTTGANNYLQTQVTEGLQAGDVVVVDGKDKIADGARVRTVERPAP